MIAPYGANAYTHSSKLVTTCMVTLQFWSETLFTHNLWPSYSLDKLKWMVRLERMFRIGIMLANLFGSMKFIGKRHIYFRGFLRECKSPKEISGGVEPWKNLVFLYCFPDEFHNSGWKNTLLGTFSHIEHESTHHISSDAIEAKLRAHVILWSSHMFVRSGSIICLSYTLFTKRKLHFLHQFFLVTRG